MNLQMICCNLHSTESFATVASAIKESDYLATDKGNGDQGIYTGT